MEILSFSKAKGFSMADDHGLPELKGHGLPNAWLQEAGFEPFQADSVLGSPQFETHMGAAGAEHKWHAFVVVGRTLILVKSPLDRLALLERLAPIATAATVARLEQLVNKAVEARAEGLSDMVVRKLLGQELAARAA